MWSADSLVPVTMYVVVRAQIQRLGAEIRLIEDFCPQLQYLGQVQYLLATLQVKYFIPTTYLLKSRSEPNFVLSVIY